MALVGACQFFGFLFVLSASCHFSFVYLQLYDMGVSKNGTPKSSFLIGFSLINHPFWGTPIFGNTHMYRLYTCFQFVTQISESSTFSEDPCLGPCIAPFSHPISPCLRIIRVFPKIGVPQNGLFIRENHIKMDDLGVPLFLETPINT